ncbi:MAG: hypothetical protein Q9184_002605 [Pyrenodesmia sp. 2 TL-2023]
MDARRFTPNLHASLVAEILSSRREIESKNGTLTALEESLHISKIDNGQLEATVNSQERELRSVKKQMQLLENGTISALGDLAKERDDAMASLADVRKRLDMSKSNVRAHEEDARRNQAMWEQDKQNWDNERRNMERKVHVAEGRLKTMIHEVTAGQASNQLSSTTGSDSEEGIGDTWFSNWSDIISTRSSSVRGRYHLSELSNNTYDTNELANLRNSFVPGRASISGREAGGLSLAEELSFEQATDDHAMRRDYEHGIASPNALPEETPIKSRRLSIQSQDHKARRILGLPTESAEQPLGREPLVEHNSTTLHEKALLALQTEKRTVWTAQDAGTQFSPPSSPKPITQDLEFVSEKDAYKGTNTENTANQRRKRVSAAATLHESFPSKPDPLSRPSTASTGCQTVLQPTSPPLVPMIALEPMFPDLSTFSGVEMVTSATQTEDRNQSNEHAGAQQLPPSNTIPVIAIHPPGSRPGTAYNDVVLPPQTKNASCQTEIPSGANSKSVAVQTEGIRVDRRPLHVPPRLMSAAAPSKPHTQNGQHPHGYPSKARRGDLRSPPPVEPPQSRSRPANIQIKDSHIGRSSESVRGEVQPSSPTIPDNPFAGFSDLEESGKDIDYSDDDDFATVAPIRKTLSKVQNSWKLVPTSMNSSLGPRPLGRPISDIQECDDAVEAGSSGMLSLAPRTPMNPMASQLGQSGKPDIPAKAPQRSDVRKAALISRGALAHTRQRSPSEPGPSTESRTVVPPPFPVPMRSSSRKIPISSSEGNGSPTPYTTSFIGATRDRAHGPPASKNILRKVRSAAAVPKFARSNIKQDEAELPTMASSATTPLGSPGLPRILRSESTPQPSGALARKLEQEASSSAFSVPGIPIDSPSPTTSVVDAIAQTMVGEWMWKYVRKRKSFGIAGAPQAELAEGRHNGESSSGIRHKRWVWLAPYERAVIWSSKQPMNGSALLGRGGRKRNARRIVFEIRANGSTVTIQSVLDVRDDNPMPNNAGIRAGFGQSILILTPQRALKFTAPSRERHDVWLTALSFLSNSTLGMEDLTVMPAVPQAEYLHAPSQLVGARRSRRDSIGLAKAKERPSLQSRNHTAPIATAAHKALTEGQRYDKANDTVSDAAEPPQIPRVSAHTRKRSNTGPRRPSLQSAFNSFPAHVSVSSVNLAKSATPRDIATSVTRGFQGNSSGPSMMRHMSETALAQPEGVRNDFFDAVGTVRMEAFVDNTKQEAVKAGKEKSLPRSSYRTRQGRKKDMRYWGIMGESNNQGVSAARGSKSAWRPDDPFNNF